MEIEFPAELLAMITDCFGAQAQAFGDLLRNHARANELEYFSLSAREVFDNIIYYSISLVMIKSQDGDGHWGLL
jgi:hypothetical protein